MGNEQRRPWQESLAQLLRTTPLHRLLIWGVRLLVPRQRIGTAVVGIDDQERILMLHHVFHPFAPWGLPGGWLKRNEAPADGALRELKEETGLTAVLGPPILVSHDTRPVHIGIAYLAKIQSGPIRLSREIIEAKWFAIDELPGPMLSSTRLAIETAVKLHRASPSEKVMVASEINANNEGGVQAANE